ncbi:MAG: hypothetical protein R3D30_05700 [Hyphomicrobiales bacterium]
MHDRAIVCNIGHFDSEIQVAGRKNFRWHNVKPQGRDRVPGRQAHHPARRGALVISAAPPAIRAS